MCQRVKQATCSVGRTPRRIDCVNGKKVIDVCKYLSPLNVIKFLIYRRHVELTPSSFSVLHGFNTDVLGINRLIK